MATSNLKDVLERASDFEASAATARLSGDEATAGRLFREALDATLNAAGGFSPPAPASDRLAYLRATVRLALQCGEVAMAHQLMDEAFDADGGPLAQQDWSEFRDMSSWPDVWLVAAVRRDPPEMPALDILVARYWKTFFARCLVLTLDHDKACDLAQQAWCRVLRSRRDLKPGGNFPGYLSTVATNLWRDDRRFSRRAGPLASHRLASLDEPAEIGREDTVVRANVLPDPNSLDAQERMLLKLDIDRALERLPPHLHETLVARFIAGESCASIGARVGRTEQTVSSWVRDAIREMKRLLEEPAREK